MRDRVDYPRTCRLCGGRAWTWDMLKYGTRAYAHYACFVKNKTLADADRLATYPRSRLDRWMQDHGSRME